MVAGYDNKLVNHIYAEDGDSSILGRRILSSCCHPGSHSDRSTFEHFV